ncbi:MAG TPA: chorismate synthase, partial [Methanosarcina sp.]|nr:chorismate synthase [Methanosarcina sp.]
MAGNFFGKMFQICTWGESHGRAVGVVVDGLPAGLSFSELDIQKELDRRRPGQSEVSTPRLEADRVEILSGVFEGKSTGTPISMLVWNSDIKSSSYEAIKNTPRPGHADFTYTSRYGIRDYRGGGRSSARETIGRVAGGALAKLLLSQFGIRIAAHVLELGGIRANPLSFEEILENVEKTPVRCADLEAAEKMLEKVAALKQEGDSTGGIVEVIARGVPPGLGEPVFDRLDADLAKAIMSIPAVKGFEIGAGFEAARLRGSEMNDPFRMEDGKITCLSNNAGGVLGGISTGLDIVC